MCVQREKPVRGCIDHPSIHPSSMALAFPGYAPAWPNSSWPASRPVPTLPLSPNTHTLRLCRRWARIKLPWSSAESPLLLLGLLGEPLRSDRLGALQGQAQSPVPEELGKHAESAADTKHDGVVVKLVHAVVTQEDAGVGVHVGPRVLGLAVLGEHVGHDLVDGGHDVEQRVVGQVLEGELALSRVARVRLAQHGVAVARDDLARVQRRPRELADGVLVDSGALGLELGLQVQDPAQHLLVGQSVQGASQGVHASSEGEVGVGQRGADQVGGVRGSVATLVVAVDHHVQAHELVKLGVVEAQHARVVGRVVERRVVGGHLAVVEGAAVDDGRHLRQLGDQVQRVL
mmetsp:Transcript_26202/g.84300  ORF Transcript_26202/g.84300 Transcript_26202/m.84300 type:complete len:345 (+) Transcript_26202:92-1126(+)